MEARVRRGIQQALRVCLAVQPGERLCLICDRERVSLAELISQEAVACGMHVSKPIVMEEFGERSNDGSTPLPFPEDIARQLVAAQVSVFLAESKKGEGESFRRPMLKLVQETAGLRHAHMPGVTPAIVASGLAVDYRKVQAVSLRVYQLVSACREVKVKTPAGADFLMRTGYRWLNSDGRITQARWMNLPAGEVFTCPLHLEGTIVIDGILGDHFAKAFGLLRDYPLTVEVIDSHVAAISSQNLELERAFREYIATDQNASRVGEFAIGTNVGLQELSGVLLQDEKFPGVHVAFGHGYPETTGSGIYSAVHADAVLLEPDVWVDGKQLMERGRFIE